MRDLRDPSLLGKALFTIKASTGISLRHAADELRPHVPDYKDETTIEKYGHPQDLPSTLPN